jgi:hypothetical protein
MSGESGILTPPSEALRKRPASRTEGPGTPPGAILEAVDAAAVIAGELAARDRELHFTTSLGGRLIVELRTLDGAVIRRLEPSEALDVMAGLVGVE